MKKPARKRKNTAPLSKARKSAPGRVASKPSRKPAKASKPSRKAPEPPKRKKPLRKPAKPSRKPRKPAAPQPRPPKGVATFQAYLDAMEVRADKRRKLTEARGAKLMAAKQSEILGFFKLHKPKSRRPARTAAKLSRRMGLLRFFQVESQYTTNPLGKLTRSDFVIDKDKNGRQFAYWRKGNRAGVRGGTRISIPDLYESIEKSKDARGAQWIRKVLKVSIQDAADIWQEMKDNPLWFEEHFGSEGRAVVESPRIGKKK